MSNYYDKLPDCLNINDEGKLCLEGIPCDMVANHCGTPSYVYSYKQIINNIEKMKAAFSRGLEGDWDIYYAYKGNASPAICKIIYEKGIKAEVMSLGELHQAITLGIKPKDIIFNGVVKTSEELEYSIKYGIGHIIIDSESESEKIQEISAHHNKITDVAFRVKPGITTGFHPHVETGHLDSKFGLTDELVIQEINKSKGMPNINFIGLQCHIGSQITDVTPYIEEADYIFSLSKRIHKELGVCTKVIDLGGGFGIQDDEQKRKYFPFDQYTNELNSLVKKYFDSPPLLCFEPSRAIVADSSIILSKAVSLKKDAGYSFVGCDAGYSTFVRPMLYGAYHDIRNVTDPTPEINELSEIVGPICETGDVIGKQRRVGNIETGTVLAILDTGSYGYAQSSIYNGRPRPREYLIHEGNIFLIRDHDSLSDLMGKYILPPIY